MNDRKLISIWSGPRHGASELLYAFAQRRDTEAIDRPFWGYFLRVSGSTHPAKEEILSSMTLHANPIVSNQILTPLKQSIRCVRFMTHHLLGLDLSFLEAITHHIFMIRRPHQVVSRFSGEIIQPDQLLESYKMQYDLFKYLTHKDIKPLVIDANMMHEEPKSALQMICSYCEVPFEKSMQERKPMADFIHAQEESWNQDFAHHQDGRSFTQSEGTLEEALAKCSEYYLNMLAEARLPQCPQERKSYMVA